MLGVGNTMETDGESWPDWGWPETAEATARRRHLPERMHEYVAARAAGVRAGAWTWGWKDPRTTLFLGEWAAVCPSATFLLLYRSPAGVAASLDRLPLAPGVKRHALDIWRMYNDHVVRFAEAERERAVVVNTDSLVRTPAAVLHHIVRRCAIPRCAPEEMAAAVEAVVDQEAIGRSLADDEGAEPFPPEVAALWAQLEALDETAHAR